MTSRVTDIRGPRWELFAAFALFLHIGETTATVGHGKCGIKTDGLIVVGVCLLTVAHAFAEQMTLVVRNSNHCSPTIAQHPARQNCPKLPLTTYVVSAIMHLP